MIRKNFPADYNMEEDFPETKLICGWEFGGAFHAIKGGIHYLIIDESMMADMLDQTDPTDKKVFDNLIHLLQFEDEEEMHLYVQRELGWATKIED
ncbi:MAG TPA: hypothetical protein PK581_04295 [Caldisericia bacterium]|jgi:hypothetical protein|nr:hypothetical protein [Caldisericia bacterium]